MNERIPVKNENIERDPVNNALIFTDVEQTKKFEKRKAEILQEKLEIDTLKRDVREIKNMLKQILSKESK